MTEFRIEFRIEFAIDLGSTQHRGGAQFRTLVSALPHDLGALSVNGTARRCKTSLHAAAKGCQPVQPLALPSVATPRRPPVVQRCAREYSADRRSQCTVA